MSSSLALQRALFRQQQRDLEGLLVGTSSAFKRYEASYRRALSRPGRGLARREVLSRVRSSDVVLVGDYHTLPQAQLEFLGLLDAALATGRRVVLGLELFEAKRQRTLDAWLAGRVKDEALMAHLGPPWSGPHGLWPSFRPILELARKKKLRVLGIDSHPSKGPSLAQRDALAGRILAEAASEPDRPLVLALMGQFHLAPAHLPAQIAKRLTGNRELLVVFQNPEGPSWRLLASGRAGRTEALDLGKNQLCLFNASPVACQQSFLDYLETQAGDVPLQADQLEQRFRALVQGIARIVGVPTGKALEQLTAVSAAEIERVPKLLDRGRFTSAERKAVLKHIGSRESAWIPKARFAWLASRSLSHAAEEAAHAVRWLSIGDAMTRERPRREAFWARVYEETLGFFGSRLLNPSRQCPSLESFHERFQRGRGTDKVTAAFVLALSSALLEPSAELGALVPHGSGEQFHEVSHAIGYLLGERLALAWEAGLIPRSQVTALFRDRLPSPRNQVRALAKRVEGLLREPR